MESNDETTKAPAVDGVKNPVDRITERVNVMLGGEGKVDLRLGDLFSQVFKRHAQEEADELFICGTKRTTPTPDKISSSWPKPWLFSRVAIVLLATFFILLACAEIFDNPFVIPSVMFVGALAVPFSTLIFLFEINAPRNVSVFRVVNVFLLGGAASIFVSLVLYRFNSSVSPTIGGSVFIGVVEELGKILIVACAINKLQTTKYLLNGLLIGGSVGAGFAVFESAGYAFLALMADQTGSSLESMKDNIVMRGFLSPGGHISWAAMEGAFLIYALDGKKFSWSTVASPSFLKLCILPMAMHAFFDMPILQIVVGGLPVKLIALEALAFIIVLVALHRGLAQINNLQNKLNPENGTPS